MLDLERKLTAAFEQIHHQRMRGLPILHPGLRVAVVGGRRWQGDWLGILLTPWCMNLVLIPGPDSAQQLGSIGSTGCIDLPAGRFELIASEEAGVGAFAACSLFSPMQDFPDQASALATAEAIMVELFDPQGPVSADFAEHAAQSPVKSPVKSPTQSPYQHPDQHPDQTSVRHPAQQPVQPRPAISRRDLLLGRLRG